MASTVLTAATDVVVVALAASVVGTGFAHLTTPFKTSLGADAEDEDDLLVDGDRVRVSVCQDAGPATTDSNLGKKIKAGYLKSSSA